MSKFFREGWDFGFFTLVIGLPIAAGLVFLFGVSVWEAVTNPVQYWMFWLFLGLWFGPALVQGARKFFRKRTGSEGLDTNG